MSTEPLLPYGRQSVDDEDVTAVVEALRSDWLTTGPRVEAFEAAFAARVGAVHAVAVSNGTAALHAAMFALKIGPGDEVIVPTLTFAATANAVVYQGGTPVFADVNRETLLLDPSAVLERITPRTRAVVAVDYAGHPCDYDSLGELADRHGFAIVADAAHSLGGGYRGRPVGSLADLSTFSFHPVKHITTGEGGMVTTDDPRLAGRMRAFRNHGITTDARERTERGDHFYEMVELGYNYRLSDLQCALGMSQLGKLDVFLRRRREIAAGYHSAFEETPGVDSLAVRPEVDHAYHLYVVQLNPENLAVQRDDVFRAFRAEGIGVNVHYVPVHLHPFYRRHFGTERGLCPCAEEAYERIVSLPIFPEMTPTDEEDVIAAARKALEPPRP